ncbi:MAG: hypothetical protein ACK5UY_08680 [Holosporales bacterium]
MNDSFDLNSLSPLAKTTFLLAGIIEKLNELDIEDLNVKEKAELRTSALHDLDKLEAAGSDVLVEDLRVILTTLIFPHFGL